MAKRTPAESEEARTMPRIPVSFAREYLPHVIAPGAAVRVAIFADVHVPYHDRRAVEAAIHGAKKRGRIDVALLNGDFLDCYQLSRWEKDPRNRRFVEELEAAAELLAYIRQQLKGCAILWKLGNHEERYWAYLTRRAPDLLDMPRFSPEEVFGLADKGAEIVGDRRVLQLGKLSIVHGHEYPAAVLSPVNAARGYFLRAKANVLGSHYHQKSEHFEPNLKDEEIAAWSTGCLCEEHPLYRPVNNWSKGFAMVEIDSDGAFQVENKRIVNGRAW